MDDKNDFYGSGEGDRLIDPSRYPKEITEYLLAEEKLLSSTSNQIDVLIEVGCMEGRYLDWAVNKNKRYIGIDIVERYIRNGQKKILSTGLNPKDYRIELGDAASIHDFLSKHKWLLAGAKTIIVFPFNSFGNMENPDAVFASLSKTQHRFLICTYFTNSFTNNVRLRYYENCGYEKIKKLVDESGVRFTSADGLNTIAYHPGYLERLSMKNGIALRTIPFSSIGMAYEGK